MIAIRRVLCPVDFSEASRQALEHAAALAQWYDARLSVLSVFVTADTIEGPSRRLDEPTRERIARDLERFIAVVPPQVRTDIRIAEASDIDREIVAHATHLPADLLVMGSHGRNGLARLVIGSVTERVLRTPPCPTLVVPPRAGRRFPHGPVQFRQIVCAVDFSPGSIAALGYALSLADDSNAHLLALNAIEVPPELIDHPNEGPADVDAIRAAAEAERLRRLRELIPQEARASHNVETAVFESAADHAIVAMAAARDADLVVLGVNHHKALDRLVFGSVAARVTRTAACPILIVPAHRADSIGAEQAAAGHVETS